MGNFYCNFTTKGPTQESVLSFLRSNDLDAYVTPRYKRWCVIYEEQTNDLDGKLIDDLGCKLSQGLGCDVLAALVADDDILCLVLYRDGRQFVEYCSRGPTSGISTICNALGRGWVVPFLWPLMQLPYVIVESWRHSWFCRLLGMPDWAVATGYRYIQQDEIPPDLDDGKSLRHS
ncbi:MAG: hypothetical protein AAGC44_03635 [Planctomycetota bacterium]